MGKFFYIYPGHQTHDDTSGWSNSQHHEGQPPLVDESDNDSGHKHSGSTNQQAEFVADTFADSFDVAEIVLL